MTSLLRELAPVPKRAASLEDQRVTAARGELASHRKPDHAGADHDRIHAVHRASVMRLTAGVARARRALR